VATALGDETLPPAETVHVYCEAGYKPVNPSMPVVVTPAGKVFVTTVAGELATMEQAIVMGPAPLFHVMVALVQSSKEGLIWTLVGPSPPPPPPVRNWLETAGAQAPAELMATTLQV